MPGAQGGRRLEAVPRMSDVAKAAGVSLGTVSNALNHPNRVAPETLQRIRGVIDELGFVRNDAATSLAAGKSNVIGFVILNLANTIFLDMSTGAEAVAGKEGFSVLLANSDMDVVRQSTYLDLFDRQQAAGILFAPMPHLLSGMERIRQRGQRVVLVNADPPAQDQCAVLANDAHGGYLAAKHLIEQGCKRLVFAGYIDSWPPLRQRYLGAVKAVNETVGAVQLELIPTREVRVEEGAAIGQQLLERKPSRRPDGIIAGADLVAAGIVGAVTAGSALRFPHDMAIIGYDDNRASWNALVPLSTVAQPGLEMGRLAASLLIEEITAGEDHVHRQVVLEPQLVVRESSRRQ
ncbi:MAG: LacI family transcriptional regulator [Propionibacteriaceae bacterium]|jgi:LacI family transcriptional regulator|nr:LacI family transcriptional regulator [Propionibacteriaceae bacterium]